jgi:hypothetical protein
MKTLSAIVIGLAIIAGVAGIFQGTTYTDSQRNQNGNAAYRDGTYMGRLTANNGAAPRIGSGRWSAYEDRSSFAAGYEQGYIETMAISRDAAHATSAAFRDGLFLGSLAVKRGEPAHLSTGRWANEHDRALFTEGYQQAYPTSDVQTAKNLVRR